MLSIWEKKIGQNKAEKTMCSKDEWECTEYWQRCSKYFKGRNFEWILSVFEEFPVLPDHELNRLIATVKCSWGIDEIL